MKKILSKLTLVIVGATLGWSSFSYADIEPLPLRDRAQVIDQLLEQRMETVLPELMRREGIDMWVLIAREYNEDPVLRTMLPSDWLSARRRTMLVLFDRGIDQQGNDLGVEALAVARYNVGNVFKSAWQPEQQPDQWARLGELINERNPEQIAINQSEHFGQADGLVATDKEHLLEALSENLRERIVSSQPLAIGWLETRTSDERRYYQDAVALAHDIIAEGFSAAAVKPNHTTTDDLVWWFRERAAAQNLGVWFHPTIKLQRSAKGIAKHGEVSGGDEVIRPGDLLHVDFGIEYLRLNTDTQQHAYVLRKGESEAPAELQQALALGNQLQDILTGQFAVGLTGNDVLLAALAEAKEADLQPQIYSHPIGYYGHGSGPTIGLWDQQAAVPHKGDYPLYDRTAYSIELNNVMPTQEWGGDIRIMLEEDAIFWDDEVQYLNGRQTELYLIGK